MALIYPTYLEYTIVPNPVKTGATDQELLILATLKTTQENEGQKVDKFVLDHIKINFGTMGAGGGQLSDTEIGKGNFPNDATRGDSNWTPTDVSEPQPDDPNAGMVVKLVPISSYNTVQTNALSIKVKGVAVNSSPGNVTLTITEVGTAYENGKPVNNPSQTTGMASLVVQKEASDNTSKITFGAVKPDISAGDSVTLNWTGGEPNFTYTLHYLLNDQPFEVTKHAPPNNQNFKGTDQYPKTGTGYDDPALILSETTTFILEIAQGGGNPSYLTTTVIVADADLVANSLTIGDPDAFPGTTNIRLNGQIQVGDDTNSAVFIVPDATSSSGFVFRKGIPTNTTNLAQIEPSGDLILYTGSISTPKKLSVKGAISAPVGTPLMTATTSKSSGGFEGQIADYTTGTDGSYNGASIDGIPGFSTTYGANNYGVYLIDLGASHKGYVKVDMYIANNGTSTATGTYNIVSTDAGRGSSGYDPTNSYEIWTCTQAATNVETGSKPNILRKLVCRYFKGRYIYIGCKDNGQGSMGLKINKVEAFQAVGLISPS